MPIIKSAIKKMRKDAKRVIHNAKYIKAYKDLLKKIKTGKGSKKNLIAKFYSAVDRAKKKNIIHKNKARRLKASVAKYEVQH